MKTKKITLWVLSLAALAASCTGGEPSLDKEVYPTEEYVRLNLMSGCGHNAATADSEATRAVWDDASGSGSLILKWEEVDIASDKTDELALILSDGEKPIAGKTSPEATDEVSYSGVAVTPQEGDAHHADLQTVLYYNSEDLQNAKYCYAISGDAHIEEKAEEGQHLAHIEMPATFTQSINQEPAFLRPNMYMYAITAYNGERTTLNFKHIPVTFRFVVTNTTSHDIVLQEASITTSSGDVVAGKSAGVAFDWSCNEAEVVFGKGGHNKVAVNIENGTIAAGKNYTAYALAMPLSEGDALKGKTLNFSIKSDNTEQVVFQLEASKLAELNGGNCHNWVSGKSYTVRINLREEKKATGEITEDNRIELVPVEAGIYTLFYEGEDGQPLSDYAEICTLTANEIAYYEDFIAENIAPREAKNIGIYNSLGERQGSIAIAEQPVRPDVPEQRLLYSFGLLSDVHIGRAEINPDTDFERALKFFNAKGVAHTCICGDITQNGKEAEYQSWAAVAALSNAPIFTTTGNHDATSSGIKPELWTQYTGLPLVFERAVEHGGTTDHYLFLGMERWNFSAAYLDYHLTWLESKLEEYRNERCFIITHLFFPDRAGNLNGIYPSGNWLKGAQLERLEAMCDRYVNSIWFSGHSHWEWWLQKFQDRANIYRTYNAALQPTSGWCVHVPSCGAPITSNGSTRVDNTAGSEGAIINVYENYIEIRGIDFVSGKYLPIATYRLDTTPYMVNASTTTQPSYYISASNFTENPKKKGATVKDVEGMPGYVDVTFTATSQGFYISNDTFTSSTTKASITVEDVQAFSNGVAVDIPAGVGFYGTSGYYLVSTNSAEVKPASYTGVQFQTSGSKYGDGPLPLTIRMKVQMAFSDTN
ncbi:MAG: metallophosphoesterase [Alistipes sp.]|nr:metallophosphoesterase [Alistipes sp.]